MRILVRHQVSFLPSVGLWLINPSKWPFTRPAAPSFVQELGLPSRRTEGPLPLCISRGWRAKNASRRGLCYALTQRRSHISIMSPQVRTAAAPTRIEIITSRMISFATCRGSRLITNLAGRLIVVGSDRSRRNGGYDRGCQPILMGHLHETPPTCGRVSPKSQF